MRNLILLVSLIGCAPDTRAGESEARGTWKPSDKGDETATCAGYCSGRSPGRCYCDAACSAWGDCCPDYHDVCDVDPRDMSDGSSTGYVDMSDGSSTNYVDMSDGSSTGYVDLAKPEAGWLVANLPGFRNQYHDGVWQNKTDINISITCALADASPGLIIDCDGFPGPPYPILEPFAVHTLSGGTLNGLVIQLDQLELFSYSYSSPDDGFGNTYTEEWSGDIVEWVTPK